MLLRARTCSAYEHNLGILEDVPGVTRTLKRRDLGGARSFVDVLVVYTVPDLTF
jgi:hypothetical protein